MPCETMDFKSFSSSSLFSSEDSCSSTESQAGWWKSDKPSKGNDSDQGIKPFEDSKEDDIVASRHESSLFSSSLSDLFSKKLRLSANNAFYGHSVDTIASNYEEEKLSDSLEELEAQIIGNLLPDEDDLLSGVTDGNNYIICDSNGDDIDELDLFSSNGGFDLGDVENPSSIERNSEIISGVRNSSIAGENSYGEHPSRTLFVRNIDSDVKDSVLKALFEQFGDIHTFDRTCKHQGSAMISYYDIRAAQNAMRALNNRLFGRKKFDIHYPIPKDSPSRNGVNQGTLEVFLYDSSISNTELQHILNVYGGIKEIHENPRSQRHKLIEFYDFRAADAALHGINRNDTTMKRLKVDQMQSTNSESNIIQPMHPEFKQECDLCLHQKSPLLKPTTSFQDLHGTSSSVPNMLPSIMKVKSVANQCEFAESSSRGQLNFDTQAALTSHPHSLPEQRRGFTSGVHQNPHEEAANINLQTPERIDNMQFCQVNSNGPFIDFDKCVSNSSANISSSFPLPVHHEQWSNSYPPPRTIWPNSPSYFDGIYAASTLQRLNQLPMSPSHMITTVLPTNNHHIQSPPFWDRRYTYAAEPITPHCVDFVPHNMFPHFGLNVHNQRGMVFPGRNHMINSFDTYKRVRSRRNVGASNLADMKRYELDIDCIKRGEDNRTTLMIKNIPNKYTSKMLLAAIDEHHKGAYDFVYLPIDFRNKCNVGYAFINMTSPSLIVPFYQGFNGKKWEKFNSEKVASLAYARIQGKAALVAHFQNSSLMNEDKRCRPILIDTDGPNAGDQVPFPIAMKPGRMRSSIHEEDSISKESD
ncbi:putative RNA recognition motif 2, nucleotide-binding alpha-beta plait domain-containing protein [Medicago truncatula]|uniref:Putative RNA recognition motif 2, nucleotide-binding alpha-beta plait domain-containing protein n=1 Tax=Medicago truncatula TaxID=3880 RepID=A0A396GW15_MEDTR|nr:protein MEI2-like 4 [Medicago truncatula]XP_024627235.1 protein MEI2-like 4 [Medicago truncatula]RHN44628.1 putative RNA recognition motif 2, nucleotide-binding alpha-beta plait domain-containing protein [Medicago truncatula]